MSDVLLAGKMLLLEIPCDKFPSEAGSGKYWVLVVGIKLSIQSVGPGRIPFFSMPLLGYALTVLGWGLELILKVFSILDDSIILFIRRTCISLC